MELTNPEWRLNNLYKIVNKDKQKIKFVRNNIQRLITACPAKRKWILKARQFGVSTNEEIEGLDEVLFTENFTFVIIAHEQDSIKKLFRIVQRAYDFMDDDIKPKLGRGGGSKYEMYFPSVNSRVYCDLESRSDTISRLHLSEIAFMKDPDKMKATIETVPMSGRVTKETTPCGMNHAYDEWQDPDSNYTKLFFPWYVFPEYAIKGTKLILTNDERLLIAKAHKLFKVKVTHDQIRFRRFKQSELKELFTQEYPEDDQSCFLSSGDAALDLSAVKELLETTKAAIHEEKYTLLFYPRQTKSRYVLAADTAEGVGGDYSVATLFDLKTWQTVAKIRGHIKPYDFAHEINDLCKQYTKGYGIPLVAIERNNHGHAVLLELSENIRYANLYRHTDEKLGWLTDRITRPIMMNQLIDAIESKRIGLDKDTLLECLTLVKNKGKIEAQDGKHDDCVIAAAIGLQMILDNQGLALYDNISDKILV